MSETEHFVYLMCSRKKNVLRGPIKVGITKNLRGRLASIRNANAREIGYAAYWPCFHEAVARLVEECFHEIHDKDRIRGEWFQMDPMIAFKRLDYYHQQTITRLAAGNLPARWRDAANGAD